MVESPCVQVCLMDPGKELCAGCYRTLPEIACWRDMSDAERLAVLSAIESRRAEASGEHPVKS